MTKRAHVQMKLCKDNLDLKIRKLNGSDYKIFTVNIHSLQVEERAHHPRGKCKYIQIEIVPNH